MKDEDSREPIRCPYCGTEGDCPHLLAAIDETFNECSGGYASDCYQEFRMVIDNSFGRLLQKGVRDDLTRESGELHELWNYAVKDYDSEDGEVSIDPYVLTRLIINLLEVSGGKKYPGSIYDGSAPGFTSVICVFHAQRPQSVFETALSELKARLRKIDK